MVLLGEVRAKAEAMVCAALVPEILAMLGQLEAAGIAPRVVFASALRRAREAAEPAKQPPLSPLQRAVRRVRVSASLHSLAVSRSGRVLCAGALGNSLAQPSILPCPERVASVSAGWGFSLVLAESGRLYAGGLCDDGIPEVRSAHRAPAALRPWLDRRVAIATAGAAHALAVDDRGAVWSWGVADDGRLARFGSTAPGLVELPGPCVAVAAGACHSLFATKNGWLFAAGHGGAGRLGLGHEADEPVATRVHAAPPVVDVAAGKYHSLAVADDRTVWAFGDNSYGQLGTGDDEDRLVPTRIHGLPADVAAVAAGAAHSVVLARSGQAWGFGNNASGQLGDQAGDSDDDEDSSAEEQDSELWAPAAIRELGTVVEVAAGSDAVGDEGHTLALTADGRLLRLGRLGPGGSTSTRLAWA